MSTLNDIGYGTTLRNKQKCQHNDIQHNGTEHKGLICDSQNK
jgi:hypothetical protein